MSRVPWAIVQAAIARYCGISIFLGHVKKGVGMG